MPKVEKRFMKEVMKSGTRKDNGFPEPFIAFIRKSDTLREYVLLKIEALPLRSKARLRKTSAIFFPASRISSASTAHTPMPI